MKAEKVSKLINDKFNMLPIRFTDFRFTTNKRYAMDILLEKVNEVIDSLNRDEIDDLKSKLAEVNAICMHFMLML